MNLINVVKAAINTDISLPTQGDPTGINDISKIREYAEEIIAILLNVAIIVGVIMILYAAFTYASSFGDESKAETAKKTLIWSAVGTIVVFFARWIATQVRNGIV